MIMHSRYKPGQVSGENRVVADEARLLSQAGHSVDLWDPLHGEDLGKLDLVRTGSDAVWSRSASRMVRNRIRERRPDVVHIHNMFPLLSPAVIRAAHKAGVPVVCTLNNYRLLCLPAIFLRDGQPCELCLGHVPWQGVRHGCYRGSKAASAAIATSLTLHRGIGTFDEVSLYLAATRFVRDKHIEGGFDPAKIRVKPNFAWTAPRRQGPGDYFLFVGWLAPEKGAALLVDIWEPSFGRLLIRGDGPQEAELRARASPQIEFVGRLEHEALQGLVAGARAVLVPSLSFEGLPRTITEAFAAGVPVIASRVGAIPEVVEDDISGLLVQDPEGWGSAVARLMDHATSLRLGAGAYAVWQDRLGPERGLADLEAAYRDVTLA